MKFGKEFVSQMVPEWKDAYVNYNSLKKLIKHIESSTDQRSRLVPPQSPYRAFSGLLRRKSMVPSSSSSDGDVENPPIKVRRNDATEVYETVILVGELDMGAVCDESEVKYFNKLDEEFNKVEKFYKLKVDEVITEAEMLNKQMDALIAFRLRVERPLNGGHDDHPAAETNGLPAQVAISVAALSSSTRPSTLKAQSKRS